MNVFDVDENLVIADSQLDYPGRDGGWQFVAMDKNGDVSPLVARSDVGPEVTTYASYRVGSADAYCNLGRDFIHPGYEQFPALAWRATSSRLIILQGEIACVSHLSLNSALVTVSIGKKAIWSGNYRFPEILRFQLHLHAVKGDLLTVHVSAEEHIDHQFGCYYFWLVDSGTAPADRFDPCLNLRSETILDEAWRDLGTEMMRIAGVPAESASKLAYDGFDAVFELPKWPERGTSSDATSANDLRELGHPRFFSVPSKADA